MSQRPANTANTEQARARLGTALRLAEDAGMHFYDAKLLRLVPAPTPTQRPRRADITAALALARRQGATLFELRAALDDFELRGEPRALPSPTRPAESPPTARSRNWRGPGPAEVVQPATRVAPRLAGRVEEATWNP